MKSIILVLIVFLVLSFMFAPVNSKELLYQGVSTKDIGIAFIGFTLALLMRTKDK